MNFTYLVIYLKMHFVVTIDGTAASGKSTTAIGVAEKLGLFYIDSGAMYRGVALAVLRAGIDITDRHAIANLARKLKFDFKIEDGKVKVFMNGEDISDIIRGSKISELSSVIATYPEVRKVLVAMQRELSQRGNTICEGRDMGTVVFPDAAIKIYMDASLEERARRRLRDLQRKGEKVSLEEVITSLKQRDERDKTRKHSPLKPAPDAIYIDTTNLTIDEEINKVVNLIKRKLKQHEAPL